MAGRHLTESVAAGTYVPVAGAAQSVATPITLTPGTDAVPLTVSRNSGSSLLQLVRGVPRGDGFDYTMLVNTGANLITNGSITSNGNSALNPYYAGAASGRNYMIGAEGDLAASDTQSIYLSFAGGLDADHFHFCRSGDTKWRLRIRPDGDLEWGSGSAATDVVLKRSAANVLQLSSAKLSIRPLQVNVPCITFYSDQYGIGIDANDLVFFTGLHTSFKDASVTGLTRMQVLGSGVSAGATALKILVSDESNPTTLRQVSVGAADSGGAGFRMLRVPNV